MISVDDNSPPEFQIEALKRALPEIAEVVSRCETFILSVPKKSSLSRPALDYLTALRGQPDKRSALRATIDAWRIQDFIVCLGLASEAGYSWDVHEYDDTIKLRFSKEEPKNAAR
ncbi:MAG: hypothetical protein AB1749_09765 [Pseudomonadota bacterium]